MRAIVIGIGVHLELTHQRINAAINSKHTAPNGYKNSGISFERNKNISLN